MRGTVTTKFDRNRRVLRLNIAVTFACMNDLDAAGISHRDQRLVGVLSKPSPASSCSFGKEAHPQD